MQDPIPALLDQLRATLGPAGLLTDPADTAAYVEDWRRLYRGRTPAVVRPADTAQVAAVVRLCAAAGVPIVPQGGNTSMVGGATPDADGGQIVLSLARLNRVRAVDPRDLTMTVDAGLTLKAAQEAAAEAGCLLGLSISSEGSAQIGGVLATNAGGNNTVRYGNARDLVLGLEVVLADGQVWNGLRRLRKDNTGYALRQLFVGSEGTLGVITAAVLKLAPAPRETAVALCAVASPEAALDLFGRFQAHDPGAVQAFEYMSGTGMGFVLQHIPGASLPLARPAGHYVLVDLATPRRDAGLRAGLETVLEAALEDGLVTDAAIAEVRGAARRAVAAAGGTLGSAEARRRLGEERRLGAGLRGARIHRRRHRSLRRADAGDPRGAVRPSRRRQHPLQPGTARGRRPGLVPRPGPRDHGHGERGGAPLRRQFLGRARGGPAQALHDARVARRGGARRDAPDQGGARSPGDPEPRQGTALSGAPAVRRAGLGISRGTPPPRGSRATPPAPPRPAAAAGRARH